MVGVNDIVAVQQGNVYVLDPKQKSLRVFSAEAKYLRNIGREGNGPVEFSEY